MCIDVTISYFIRNSKVDKIYSLDKICESNNDCSDNEICDSPIGICVCSDGFQLDDSKKFCVSNADSVGLGVNSSGYDVDEVSNAIPEQQQEQQPLETTKKVIINECYY